MCVLTYIPTLSGYFVTSNRDEATARLKATPPKAYELNQRTLHFPRDPQGGGTWIATDGKTTACLLNGGYVNHVRKLPYRQSRGLVVTDFFSYFSVIEFYENYRFAGIEPFTLVIFSPEKPEPIYEIRWTGKRADLNKINASKPQIWSSATLYSDEIIAERKQWFQDFVGDRFVSPEAILQFHRFGGKGDQRNDINMNRNGILKTVAITQFEISEDDFGIRYQDL